MKKIKIMAVCGFGVGTSMILKMTIGDVMTANDIKAELFTADQTTAGSQDCDIIFTSAELAQNFQNAKVPVVVINNFLSKKEIEEKGLPAVQELLKS
jgi:PTS system ascorbate-specific IIB component